MLKTIRIEVESANKPYAVVKRPHYSRHIARRHILPMVVDSNRCSRWIGKTKNTSYRRNIYFFSDVFMLRAIAFAGFIQGYIFKPAKKFTLFFSYTPPQ